MSWVLSVASLYESVSFVAERESHPPLILNALEVIDFQGILFVNGNLMWTHIFCLYRKNVFHQQLRLLGKDWDGQKNNPADLGVLPLASEAVCFNLLPTQGRLGWVLFIQHRADGESIIAIPFYNLFVIASQVERAQITFWVMISGRPIKRIVLVY